MPTLWPQFIFPIIQKETNEEVFKDPFGDDKPIATLTNAGHFLQKDEPDLQVAPVV